MTGGSVRGSANEIRYKTSPEAIRLAVLTYDRFWLSLRQAEELLHERGIDTCHETLGSRWNRFGPPFGGRDRERT